jgi:hypothetical protein
MISVAKLLKEMPDGYEESCFEEKAIQRKRGITSPGDLMMLCLFHLLNGCSLVEVSEIARLTKLGIVSDVAFMKRFENCNNWFKWILSRLMLLTVGLIQYIKPEWLEEYRVLAVDASDIKEKGRSGRIYRFHFALDIFKMESVYYSITSQNTGETLKNYNLSSKDLVIADRAYSSLKGMDHCIKSDASFVLRLRKNNFKIYDDTGAEINLLQYLQKLEGKNTLDLRVNVNMDKDQQTPIRVCAIRKTEDNIVSTKKRIKDIERRKQTVIAADTKEFNEYIVLVTNLPERIPSEQVLELYRLRWQVEIHFKRLKSILDFGELPKRREESVMAWLNGKIMIALLMEKIIGKGAFPPSGDEFYAEHMERDEASIINIYD